MHRGLLIGEGAQGKRAYTGGAIQGGGRRPTTSTGDHLRTQYLGARNSWCAKSRFAPSTDLATVAQP